MGFWDSLGGALKDAGKGMMESARNMQECKVKYASYSDSRLVDIFKNGSFSEKAAANAVLKERYGEEGAKEVMRRYY